MPKIGRPGLNGVSTDKHLYLQYNGPPQLASSWQEAGERAAKKHGIKIAKRAFNAMDKLAFSSHDPDTLKKLFLRADKDSPGECASSETNMLISALWDLANRIIVSATATKIRENPLIAEHLHTEGTDIYTDDGADVGKLSSRLTWGSFLSSMIHYDENNKGKKGEWCHYYTFLTGAVALQTRSFLSELSKKEKTSGRTIVLEEQVIW